MAFSHHENMKIKGNAAISYAEILLEIFWDLFKSIQLIIHREDIAGFDLCAKTICYEI